MCYSSTTGLAGLFDGGNCLFNEDRETCFAAISNSFLSPSSNIQWPLRVTAECFTDFTMFVDTTPTENCTNGCRRGLQQARDELGCCMDAIYNNSFVREYLPFAEYSLWSNCGIETPGVCSSASALYMGIYLLLAIIVLKTILLYSIPTLHKTKVFGCYLLVCTI